MKLSLISAGNACEEAIPTVLAPRQQTASFVLIQNEKAVIKRYEMQDANPNFEVDMRLCASVTLPLSTAHSSCTWSLDRSSKHAPQQNKPSSCNSPEAQEATCPAPKRTTRRYGGLIINGKVGSDGGYKLTDKPSPQSKTLLIPTPCFPPASCPLHPAPCTLHPAPEIKMKLPAEIFLALRYLKPKRTFISIITLLSILGPTLGVAILLIVSSVMAGFDRDIREGIMSMQAHLTAYPVLAESFAKPLEIVEQLEKHGLKSTPVIEAIR